MPRRLVTVVAILVFVAVVAAAVRVAAAVVVVAAVRQGGDVVPAESSRPQDFLEDQQSTPADARMGEH